MTCSPSFNRVAAAFHACSEATVKGVDHLLLLAYRLLVLPGALLSCLSASDHRTGDRPDSCPLPASPAIAPIAAPPAAPRNAPAARWPPPTAGPVCCGGGLDATTAGSMPVVLFAHA